MELLICCDGGARGNPGPAACAFVAKDGELEIEKGSKYLGLRTNNYAEYSAVILAMEWLKKNNRKIKFSKITFILDSELVVKQLMGKYKIKSTNLKPLALKAKQLEKDLKVNLSFRSLLRVKNKTADGLVNKILDEKLKSFTSFP